MSLKKVLSKYSRWLWLFLWGICQVLGYNKFKVNVMHASVKLVLLRRKKWGLLKFKILLVNVGRNCR